MIGQRGTWVYTSLVTATARRKLTSSHHRLSSGSRSLSQSMPRVLRVSHDCDKAEK